MSKEPVKNMLTGWMEAFLVACVLVSGCSTGPMRPDMQSTELFHDEAFPKSAGYKVESMNEVFALDREAKKHLDRNINSIRDYHDRSRALLDEIFQQAKLNLSYDSNANTTASETFHSRNANCLSLSILTYAMAEYTGFDATFQEVDVPEYWERRNNYSLMNRHVNIRITPSISTSTMAVFRQVELEVDFQPLAGRYRLPVQSISKSRALAMFYNNKGIDALLVGRHDVAYAYLRAALLQDPTLDMALTNLGLLYGVNGHLQWAEASYRQAIDINGENAVSAENLAILLKMTDRENEAEVILARLANERENNPYYFYIQGEEAYDAGDVQQAIRHFRKAVALKPNADQFHYGLAKSYARLGDSEKAETYLRRAERHANYADLKEKYRNKISALSDL